MAVAACAAVTACGSSTSTGTHAATSTSGPAQSSLGSPTAPPAGTPPTPGLPAPWVSAASGRVRGWLHGENHNPKTGRLWSYTVLAADPANRLLSGTADTEFVFNGHVVGRESPPTHALKNGKLVDQVTFPAQSVGVPLTFRVVVHSAGGSVTLDWPVVGQH